MFHALKGLPGEFSAAATALRIRSKPLKFDELASLLNDEHVIVEKNQTSAVLIAAQSSNNTSTLSNTQGHIKGGSVTTSGVSSVQDQGFTLLACICLKTVVHPHNFIRILVVWGEVSIEEEEISHNLRAGFQVFKVVSHPMLGWPFV